jgi:hypothetical protein
MVSVTARGHARHSAEISIAARLPMEGFWLPPLSGMTGA